MQVKQSDLGRALCCLSKTFRLISDSDNRADVALVDSIERQSACLEAPIRLQSKSMEAAQLCMLARECYMY